MTRLTSFNNESIKTMKRLKAVNEVEVYWRLRGYCSKDDALPPLLKEGDLAARWFREGQAMR